MSAAENKEIIRKFNEAKSLDEMLSLMADDVRWTLIGNTRFSGTLNGKKEFLDKLMYPLFAQMESMGTGTTLNVIAEGDYVVRPDAGKGRRTKTGQRLQQYLLYRLSAFRRQSQRGHRVLRHRIDHGGLRKIRSWPDLFLE